ncbi:hypothetical protein Kfla_2332 [Kribbella flavida DSM 17836]|uniref:Uncharacterized protein n=1 Tax=Kribbella flavida (strain DSM 17836 / JCM 10339 / NBRC 14399) TaxID=479435 RepID=D2PUU2_KRIFD|nr:hypothetical protein [Kribbella flavida]ADB31408.1 hypothetical protein Kfla_2332 [Kribbella flavida DSM 17836]
MASELLPRLAPLTEAAGEASHISPWWYGGFSLFVLVALLAVTVILGNGRPHS